MTVMYHPGTVKVAFYQAVFHQTLRTLHPRTATNERNIRNFYRYSLSHETNKKKKLYQIRMLSRSLPRVETNLY